MCFLAIAVGIANGVTVAGKSTLMAATCNASYWLRTLFVGMGDIKNFATIIQAIIVTINVIVLYVGGFKNPWVFLDNDFMDLATN